MWHYCDNIEKHHFGPQMRGFIGNPPSPAGPQLRMASSDSSMAHISYGKRAPRPCEHISVSCRFSKEGSKKGHLAPIVAHSAYSRRIFGIVHTVWDAGVRISTALDIRRGSGLVLVPRYTQLHASERGQSERRLSTIHVFLYRATRYRRPTRHLSSV